MKRFFSAVTATLLSPLLQATEPCPPTSADCAAVGEWQVALGIGLGVRTNPLADGKAMPIVLLPQLSYYGEHWFFDTDTLGLTLVDSERHMLNAIATLGYDHMYFHQWSLGNFAIDSGGLNAQVNGQYKALGEGQTSSDGEIFDHGVAISGEQTLALDGAGEAIDLDTLHKRSPTGLAGLDYAWYAGRFAFNLQALQDFTGVHGGRQLRAATSWRWQGARNHYSLSLGLTWQDAATLHYSFGIDVDEVSNPYNAYRARADFSPFARLDWRYHLSQKWQLQATLNHRWLGQAITDSPLVDSHGVTAFFIGGVRHF